VSQPIRVLVTGGTFDKEYDELSGRLFFRRTHVREMLRLARCRVEVKVEAVMMKDSLEMDDRDRSAVVARCRSAPERRIVITHGTDTMAETARTLHAAALGKTVVLTGAMVPYAFGSSDGLFNLGSALSFAQVLPAGVWVAMNGRIFPGDRVRKDRATGVFEEVRAAGATPTSRRPRGRTPRAGGAGPPRPSRTRSAPARAGSRPRTAGG
jgi:L-asparaginase